MPRRGRAPAVRGLAREAPDSNLPRDLEEGFPLVGVLPRSGMNAEVVPKEAACPSELRGRADNVNAATLERVCRDPGTDAEATQILHQKAYEEARARARAPREPARAAAPAAAPARMQVAAGQATWVRLSDLPRGAILNPRFPVNEGWRWKESGWARKEVRIRRG